MLRIMFMAVALIGVSAHSQTTISGTAKNGNGQYLYLHKLVQNNPVVVDSVKIDKKDRFSFELKDIQTGFYRVGRNLQDFALLILSDEKSHVKMEADYNAFAVSYDITSGSEPSKAARDFLAEGRTYIQQRDSLGQLYRSGDGKAAQHKTAINDLGLAFMDKRDQFINNNLNSPAALVALQYINPKQDIEQFRQITESAQKTMPGSFYATALKGQLSTMIVPGNEAPDLAFKDPDGKERKLSDLKGKVVLLDFWASWCRPCRAENPNVVRLYNKYKEAGFDIFSVSLDKAMDRWKGAIKADGLVWENHVSDLKGWSSEPGQIYGVSSIPHTVLIDKEGKIKELNLRGHELEEKLKEIFGF